MEKSDDIREKILESSEPESSEASTGALGEAEVDEPKEITVRVVVLSVILAIVLGSANVYLGLFAGAF